MLILFFRRRFYARGAPLLASGMQFMPDTSIARHFLGLSK